MAQQKSFRPLRLFTLSLFLELLIVPIFLTKVDASEPVNRSQLLFNGSIARITFEPPRDGKPDDTAEGASRGDECPQAAIAIGQCVTPLVPATKNKLTVAEHPTLFVYVPQTSAQELFFGLIDENNKFYYQTKILLPSKPGILGFKLPDNLPPLEVNKSYRWTFILIGEQGLRPDSPGVRGEIRRVELPSELKSQLQNQPLLERAGSYGKNGIWYDTLASLAEARRAQPGNVTVASAWKEFLNSVGLQAIATKPLLN